MVVPVVNLQVLLLLAALASNDVGVARQLAVGANSETLQPGQLQKQKMPLPCRQENGQQFAIGAGLLKATESAEREQWCPQCHVDQEGKSKYKVLQLGHMKQHVDIESGGVALFHHTELEISVRGFAMPYLYSENCCPVRIN
jgi:hypothetical protein